MDLNELKTRLDDADQDEDKLEAVVTWLVETQEVPIDSARLMVAVGSANRRGDDLETVFP